ncbi:MAG: serine/threonine-protein kinase, partial [Planctomycetota bacterium]
MTNQDDPTANEDLLAGLEGEVDRRRAAAALAAFEDALDEDEWTGHGDPGLPSDYSVTGVLGSGASGVVYEARQESLDRRVAVKVLFATGPRRQTERLIGEARRLAGLRHPAIVGVHEVGRAQSGLYLTMDLFEGGSLQQCLAKGPLGASRAAQVVRQVAEGVAYIHARGIVHLDLKPGNVLLDQDGNAAVADFGIAREAAGAPLTHSSSMLLGTPAFMSPEQAADERAQIGELTDVYGLGALLYAAVSGGAPFEATGLADVLQAVRSEEPRALKERAPSAPRDLAAIAAKAMSKTPEDRYASASALAADLARFLDGEPVEARLPGVLRRASRSVQRHRREVTVALAGACLGLLPLMSREPAQVQSGEAWLRAAHELVAAGAPQAAEAFLDDVPRWVEMTGPQEDRRRALMDQVERSLLAAALPRADAAPEVEETRDAASVETGLSPETLEWVGVRAPRSRAALGSQNELSPLELELSWHDLIDTLALDRSLGPETSPELTSLLDALPHWSSTNGFAGWFDPAPADSADLWRRQLAGDSVMGEELSCRVAVQLVFFNADGAAELGELWTGTSVAASRLRFEGRGHMSLPIPGTWFGADAVRICPPGGRRSKPGDWRFEVEGHLDSTSAGPYWRIRDCEPWVKVPDRQGSWFLKDASTGLLAGSTEVIELRQDEWNDGSIATLALAHVALPG